jgi:hypothetical protein
MESFNLPLSNYSNFGNEGSGGNKMGALENLQVKDIALVSFLQIDGFKYLWKWPCIANNILLGRVC